MLNKVGIRRKLLNFRFTTNIISTNLHNQINCKRSIACLKIQVLHEHKQKTLRPHTGAAITLGKEL